MRNLRIIKLFCVNNHFCHSFVVVGYWLGLGLLWFWHLWWEIGLVDLLPVVGLGKHCLRLLWIEPRAGVLVAVADVDA